MPTPRKRPSSKKQGMPSRESSQHVQHTQGRSKPLKASKSTGMMGAPKARRTSMSFQENAPHSNVQSAPKPRSMPKQKMRQDSPQKSGSHQKNPKNAGSAPQNMRQRSPRAQQRPHSESVSDANIAAGMWTERNNQSQKGGTSRNAGPHVAGSAIGPSVANVLKKIAGYILIALSAIGRGLKWAVFALGNLIRRSKVALAVFIVVVLLGVGYIVDTSANMNKVNGNVTIGTVDVGGMTLQEAEQAVADQYSPRMNSGSVNIYASQAAMDANATNPEVDDYASVEETAAQQVVWTTDANTLQARIDYESLAKAAMQKGRGGLFDRIAVMFGGANVPMSINYNAASLEALCAQIDQTLGYAYVNWGIQVAGGTATVIEGHDGYMVNRATFASNLTDRFTCDPTQKRAFVTSAEYTPVQVDQGDAQTAAGKVNTAIGQGAKFNYESQTWTADASTLGSWVQTTIAKDSSGNTTLQPSFNTNTARTDVLNYIQPTFTGGSGTVTFANNNGAITVNIDAEGQMPQVADAITALNDKLFSSSANTFTDTPTIDITGVNIPSQMSFDDALSYGVITKVQEYTTEYTSGAEARNHNIHLAASLLNNSIAKANGGEWSFNDVAGECNAEKGFLAAGVIVDNDYTDEIGGGICQVATTVFNAVYEAGYPVIERTNHSLYTSLYPTGRDAAINWPNLNLVWENDSSSDVLMKTAYTDTTVTCTLYGISPRYKVSTSEGNWVEGDKFETKYTYDSTLSKGYTYTKTNGVNGKSITITRTVTDAAGNLLHTDYFHSTYSPRAEVIVRGGTKDDYTDEPQTNGTDVTKTSTT